MTAQPIQDHRTEATIENVRNRISLIEGLNARGVGTALWHQQFELACLRMLLAGMDSKAVAKVETVGVCWYADNGVPRKPAVGAELYAAPPAQVSVPVMADFPETMTPEMIRAVQLNSELGAYAAANMAGAYGMFDEFWKVACRAMNKSKPEKEKGE